jgi:hypothetical protein
MTTERQKIALCIASKAAGGRYEAADCHHQACPLGLTEREAKHCPCQTRTSVGRVGGYGYNTPRGRSLPTSEQVVRVIECCFPNTWDGTPVRNPEGFASYLRRKAKVKQLG